MNGQCIYGGGQRVAMQRRNVFVPLACAERDRINDAVCYFLSLARSDRHPGAATNDTSNDTISLERRPLSSS